MIVETKPEQHGAEAQFDRGTAGQRFIALIVDCVIILISAQLLAALAFTLSAGRVQFQPTLLASFACQRLNSIPIGFDIPDRFEPNGVVGCTHAFVVLPTASSVTLIHWTADRDPKKAHTVTQAVDVSYKQAISPIRLEPFVIPLFLLMRLAFDSLNRTPGRRFKRQRITVTATGTDSVAPRRLRHVGMRYLIFGACLLPYIATNETPAPEGLAAELMPKPQTLQVGFFMTLGGKTKMIGPIWFGMTSWIISIGAVLIAFVQIVRGKDAFYDRLAETAVEVD